MNLRLSNISYWGCWLCLFRHVRFSAGFCPAVGVPQRQSGQCYPSYERIAEKAGCARSTVAEG